MVKTDTGVLSTEKFLKANIGDAPVCFAFFRNLVFISETKYSFAKKYCSMLYEEFPYLPNLIFIIIFLTLYVLFLLTLQNTFKAISPENRLMEPGAVWRILIPFYNFYFVFVLVQRLASSIAAQLEASGEPVPNSRPTVNIGLLWAILTITNFFLNVIEFKDLGLSLSIASVVCLVIYWISVATWKKKIQHHPVILLDIEREQKLKEI